MTVTRRLQGLSGVLCGGAIAIVAATCASPGAGRSATELGGTSMGARWSVTVVSPTRGIESAERAHLQLTLQATLTQIDRLMSTWDASSEVSRFNASASTEPFDVSPETFEVFQWSAGLVAETEGAMDPTVGPLIDAWGFGADRTHTPPTDDTIDRLRADVGMAHVERDPAGQWVRKRRPGVQVNFSAVAPGYAADRLAAQLQMLGYADVLIDVGGEVLARGRNAGGQPWQVALESPDATAGRVVALDNAAVSTSGDYRNFRVVDGRRLTHVLDPRTGRPVAHALASVSVIAKDAVHADALSTALMVMGPDAAMAFATSHQLAARLVVRTSTGAFEERLSPAFSPRP